MFSADTTTRLTDARSLIASATSGTYDAAHLVNPSAPAPTSRRNRPSPRETSAPAAWTKCHRCIASSDWHAASRYRRSRLLESDHQSAVASRLLLRPWVRRTSLAAALHSDPFRKRAVRESWRSRQAFLPGSTRVRSRRRERCYSSDEFWPFPEPCSDRFASFRASASLELPASCPPLPLVQSRITPAARALCSPSPCDEDCGANGDHDAHIRLGTWTIPIASDQWTLRRRPYPNHCDCCRCIPRWCIASDDRETLWR